MNSSSYETQIASLLDDLSDVQSDLLTLLGKKRDLIASGDVQGLEAAQTHADALVGRLAACQERRQSLLSQAHADGLPDGSVRSLATAVTADHGGKLDPAFADSQKRTRLLQHQSLTNWVIVQRSLIHLSQMIEILATGGRRKPTYGKGYAAGDSGALVDRAV